MAGHQRAKGGTAGTGTVLPLLPLLLGVLVIGLTLGLGGRAAPDPTAGSAPATSIDPLYLGHGVGIVGTTPTFGRGCPRLYSTTDFTHWHTISPPQPASSVGRCAYVWSSAAFVSPEQGWVLGRNGGSIDTVLYRTVDGGRSWMKEPGSTTGSNGGEQVIGFTSPTDGWRQQFATGANGPYLLETTADGGANWTELPQQATNGGCMFAPDAFANPADGYAAPGLAVDFGTPPPQPFIWRTADGGRSWSPFVVARPAGVTGVAAYANPPTFLTATVGILPVSYGVGSGAPTIAFYATSDAGSSWTLASTTRSRSGRGTSSPSSPSIATGSATCTASPAPPQPAPPNVAVASPSVWWVMAPGDGTVAVTTDHGTTWTHVRTTGLHAAGTVLSSFSAANGRVAWATTSNESVGQRSFQTLDGGRTWTTLRPRTANAASVATATSPCSVGQLAVTLGNSAVGLGHGGHPILFTNTSDHTCDLRGYPHVGGRTASGRILRARHTLTGYLGGLEGSPHRSPPTVVLAPGRTASAMLEGDTQPAAVRCPSTSNISVRAPHTDRSVRLHVGQPQYECLWQVHPVVSGTRGILGPE